MKIRDFSFLTFFLLLLVLTSCQSTPLSAVPSGVGLFTKQRPPQEPPADIQRTADMPLVAAIPGLNVPFGPEGSFQFGKLTEMLDAENIPSFVVGYDDKVHPLTAVANLYSDEYSIALTRILPHLTRAVEQENEIRAAQNVPPLKELDIISYSQGSVLILDLMLKLLHFEDELGSLKKVMGDEWEVFRADPELQIFGEAATDFLILQKIRVQRQKEFDRDYDFKHFYDRSFRRFAKAYERLKLYLTDPKKVYPNARIESGQSLFTDKSAGYPRRYPKMVEWFAQEYPATDAEDSISVDFWLRYVEYEDLINLKLRFFSMSGSFFGSPNADTAYELLKFLPGGMDQLFVGPAKEQIKQTRLGSRHHLEFIKRLLEHAARDTAGHRDGTTYFIVGANGEKGDGLVDQSSAHLSSHLLTEISVEVLLDDENKEPLIFPFKRLPRYPVTGLKVQHLSNRKLLGIKSPGVADINAKSEAWPFILAFLRKDFKQLAALHSEHNQKLRQFMVELDLPYTEELKGINFTLKPGSPDIKLTGRYFNRTANTIVWTGVFKSKKYFFSASSEEPPRSASVVLKASKTLGSSQEVVLQVNPGTNHFVQLLSEQGGTQTKPYNFGLPNLFQWIPRNTFLGMLSKEK